MDDDDLIKKKKPARKNSTAGITPLSLTRENLPAEVHLKSKPRSRTSSFSSSVDGGHSSAVVSVTDELMKDDNDDEVGKQRCVSSF